LRAFQRAVRQALAVRFAPVPVVEEWMAFPRNSGHYGPVLDVAVGPFAYGDLRLGLQYDQLAREHSALLARLWDASVETIQQYDPSGMPSSFDEALAGNPNARCFLAIEIEHRVSRKHLMGGALNASALGRLALLVGWTPDKVAALVRLRRYLGYLSAVGKPSVVVPNLLILSPAQLRAALKG
jgi:hypothetical protein